MRYAYRIKNRLPNTSGLVTGHYAAQAPATTALYHHIGRVNKCYTDTAKIKAIAKQDYELVRYALVEVDDGA